MTLRETILLISISIFINNSFASNDSLQIKTGAEQIDKYISLLKCKKIGVVANQTSVIGKTHLIDSLISLGIEITKIYSPEHGFRGNADAGEAVGSNIDKKTGISVLSLYGDHKKPQKSDLDGVDLIVFDIQDVGVRFYTYISTMHYVMEACAENNIPIIILDRPNPNGFYVDGPVLNTKFKSFVGMHAVPLVHGMTIGEYAQMIDGERWLNNKIKCNLKIITCENYTHQLKYNLPVNPSPNLATMNAIYLYPSLGLFEGTAISVARGTYFPFEAIGHPDFTGLSFSFTPKSIEGKSKNPPYLNKACFGYDLRSDSIVIFTLKWVIDCYHQFPNKEKYFNLFFSKLIGNDQIALQIKKGMTEDQIRKTWEKDLKIFKNIRKKYLLYNDFTSK